MVKSIFKEIVIIILLLLTILLLFGIAFYNYMPTSKTVPTKIEEYAIEEDVKKELNEELNKTDSEEVVKTYLLDATDLAAYEQTKEYNKGKTNPFSKTSSSSSGSSSSKSSSGTEDSGDSGSSESSSSSSSSSSSNNTASQTSSSTSQGTYLNSVGK